MDILLVNGDRYFEADVTTHILEIYMNAIPSSKFFAGYWDFRNIVSSPRYYLCHVIGNTKPVNWKPPFRIQLKYLILQNSII